MGTLSSSSAQPKSKNRSRVAHALQGASAPDSVQSTSSTENDRLKAGLQPTQHTPLNLSTRAKHSHSSISANAKRLLKWPPFYFSLAFLIYLLIGALNPAAEVVRDERGWWVQAIPSRWSIRLPTSVRSDFEPMNAWRVLESFTGATALFWGIWAGLTRRKAVLLVLWSLLLSGASMAFLAILQHLSGADAVLWTFPSSNENFWGSFFYRNQGAAYLNLILVAAGVLFFYHAYKTREKGRSGGPHFLCFILFAAVATSVGLALSRGGILFASVLSLAFLSFIVVYALQGLAHLGSLWSALIPLMILVVGALVLIRYIDLDAIEQRFGDIGETVENADQDARALSTRATWDMAQDRLAIGWGAGSFRYIFPMYQREYPEIFYARYHKKKDQWIGRRAYRYAHNDIAQFVAEYGLIGSGLIALAILSMIFPLIFQLNPLVSAYQGGDGSTYSTLFLFAGMACACLHATLDFIFNSPAYWIAFLALITATAKLLRLEAERRSSRI